MAVPADVSREKNRPREKVQEEGMVVEMVVDDTE